MLVLVPVMIVVALVGLLELVLDAVLELISVVSTALFLYKLRWLLTP